MTIDCSKFDDLLLEGDPYSMQEAARHARNCDACMQRLTEWNEISETAQSLHEEWQSDMLWPRIQRAIANEKRSHFRQMTWRVAAAVVLTVTLGGTSWLMIHRAHNASFDRDILRVSALDEVERAEHAHVQAIDKLEKVVEPKLEQTESPLLVSYKEKLMLLDDAIAECQTNIDQNRQNAYLRRQLLAIYSEKQKTLEAVMREEPHVANP